MSVVTFLKKTASPLGIVCREAGLGRSDSTNDSLASLAIPSMRKRIVTSSGSEFGVSCILSVSNEKSRAPVVIYNDNNNIIN